jgi:hypothetical protein
MQRIEGDGAVRDIEFAKQLLCGGTLVGLLIDLDMRQDQTKLGVERVQQLCCLRSLKLSKLRLSTLPSSAMVCREGPLAPSRRPAAWRRKTCSTILRIEALEDVANGGMGWRALPAQTEGGVQAAAVHRDESFARAIGVAAGDHGENRE